MAKEAKKAGRPTVLTEEVIRKIEEVAALDGTVEEMALYAGVHRDTIYARLESDKDFSDRIRELRERPVLKARGTIVKNLTNPLTAQWYLSRKKKKEFAERIEKTGADGGPVQVEDSAKISELTKQLNELHRARSRGGNGEPASSLGTETPD